MILVLFGLTRCDRSFCQNIDIELLRKINLERNNNLDNQFQFISNSLGYIEASSPLLLFGTGYLRHDKKMINKSIYIALSLVTNEVIKTGMKYTINRERPFATYPDIEKLSDGGSPSFPSGHTSSAFALATSLSVSYPKWYIIAPSYLWAGLVGYSRMYLGVHYPSDVLGGMVIGAGSAYLGIYINKWLNNKLTKRKSKENLLITP